MDAMLEMRYRCSVCDLVTGNPTRVHVCPSCNRQVCSDCLVAHREGHRRVAPPEREGAG